jgi:uncharacterized membrane protein
VYGISICVVCLQHKQCLYNSNHTNTMETNWIILAIVLVGAIALIVYLIVRNQKDKKDVIKSFNADTDTENKSERHKDEE